MKKKIIYTISAILAIIGLILMWQGKKRAGKTLEVVEVKAGTIIQEVSASGTVKPAKEIALEFENQGKIKEVLVKKGEKVVTGQELIKLDTAELSLQTLEANTAVEITQAELEKIIAGASKEDIQVYETGLANAKAALENKRLALANVKSDAENKLAQAYEDVPDILNDAYLKSDDAVHKQADDLFSNDDTDNPKLTFATADTQIKDDLEWQRRVAGQELKNLKTEIISLSTSDFNGLDEALNKARQHLISIRDFLNKAMEALNFAVISSNLSSSGLITYKTNVNTARTNINTALANITTQEQTIPTTKITNKDNFDTAQTAVDLAEAEVKTAQDQLNLKKAAPQRPDIAMAKARLKQTQTSFLRVKEKLNQAVLHSPIEGIITKINAETGEMARVGQPILSLIGLQNLEIEVDIYEEDAVKLNIENPVSISLVAFPDKIFKGRVIAIEPAEKIVEGVVYYQTSIAFEEIPQGLKPGMTADITIKTASKENVLIIPKSIVQKKGIKTTVMVLKNGMIEDREIETGIEGPDGMVEVISGLNEGEKVVIK